MRIRNTDFKYRYVTEPGCKSPGKICIVIHEYVHGKCANTYEEYISYRYLITFTLVTPTTEMDTQQLGVGPPGDDDYMNLVAEETHRDTGGGRNPNMSSGAPEKMELCQMVDRLLAL